MFGYVTANKPELKIREFARYKGYYCGLCHTLLENHGRRGQMTLTYDMTFLVILLSSLYEPKEEEMRKRCLIHPAKKQYMIQNEVSVYASDMNILLTYDHLKDDWDDERKISGFFGMKVFSATDIGQKRTMNQDFVFASASPVGNLPNLFVVADGMGGHNAGDFASRYGVSVLVESVKRDTNFNPVRIIRHGIEAANSQIFEQAKRDISMEGMGTTMVVATVVGNYAYVANVGDSRLYLAADGTFDQVTQDHSLIAEMVRLGELTPEQARNHPDKNIITRAVGTQDTVKIDFFDIQLEEGNQLVMCSDGLSNMVTDEEIFELICREDGEDKAKRLIDKANANGGRDNIAVIVVEPFTNEVKEC